MANWDLLVLPDKMDALDHPALLEQEDSLVSWDSLDPRVLLVREANLVRGE